MPRKAAPGDHPPMEALPRQADDQSRVFLAGPADAGLRLDRFLSREADLPRARAQKAIQLGQCRLDGDVCRDNSLKLRPGQSVSLLLPREEASPAPERGDITLVYSDEDLAVLNKPPHLTVHPCPSCPEGTLINRLLAHFPALARQEGPRPGIVHRLDKETSGLMVIALKDETRLALSKAFAERDVGKTYLALCRGIPESPSSSRLPLGRHPTIKTKMAVVPETKGGKAAFSEWRNLYEDPQGRFALVAVTIHTGRTHQIRVHLAQAGHPLWGDKAYGPRDATDPASRQMLHAWELSFPHPRGGACLRFRRPPPPDFLRTALALSRTTQKLVLTGSPGCGKSALLNLLRKKDIPVWSADACVAELYKPGADGWSLLRGRFGDRFISGPKADVDRKALTLALLEDPGLRPELESMIHPLAYAALRAFFAGAEAAGRELAVAEVPLWFESRRQYGVMPGPLTLTVACPAGIRHQRLSRSRGWSSKKMASMEAWQWPEEAKAKASDFVLENAGDMASLRRKADALLQALALRRREAEETLSQHLSQLWSGPASGEEN